MARPLVVEIFGNARQFTREMDKAAGKTRQFSKAAGVAGTAITGGLVIALHKSVGAAMDSQRVNELTKNQLRALGISYQDQAKHIDKVIQRTSKLAAIDDEELQGAFNDLVRSSGSVNTALRDTALAANISRGAHISLMRAERTVIAAEQGRTTALRRLGIDIPKITKAQDALKESHKNYTQAQLDAAKATDANATKQAALAALQQKFAGSAEAYGKTAAGSQERLGVAIENLEESLGMLLLPTITKVADAMSKLAGYLEEHKTLAKALVIGFGALGAALLAVSVATKLANLAMLASPWGAVVIAVAAVVVGIVELVKHWDQVKAKMMEVWNWVKGTFIPIWDAVKGAFKSVLDWLRGNWPIIATLISGPFIPIVALATDAFGVRSALIGAFNAIKVFTKGVIVDIAGFWKELPGKMGAAIGGAIGDLKSAIANIFDWHKILKWVRDALDFHSPAPWAVQIGKDIVGSIAHGVGSAAGVLKDAVTGLASQFISSVGGGGSGLLDRATGAGSAPYAHGLVPQVLHALTYARQHGWHGNVISGFRTRAEQEALYARYVASGYDPRYIAARPGTSSHEFGQAVDVSDAGTFDKIMANAPPYARLMNNVPGDFNHFSVSGRALGGPVMAGTPYIVGEKGPELFVPDKTGVIWPDPEGTAGTTGTRFPKPIQDALDKWMEKIDLVSFLRDAFSKMGTGQSVDLNSPAAKWFRQAAQDMFKGGNLLGQSFKEGLDSSLQSDTIQGPIASAKAVADQYAETTGQQNLEGEGKDMGLSFAKGIGSAREQVAANMKGLSDAAMHPLGLGAQIGPSTSPVGVGAVSSNPTIIHSVLQLDGKTVYESWKQQASYDVTRNGSTGIRGT